MNTPTNPFAFRIPTLLEFVQWGHESGPSDRPVECTDLRAHARSKVHGKATISGPSGPMQVRVLDLHESGAGISANKPLAPGSVVFVRFKEFKLMGYAQRPPLHQPRHMELCHRFGVSKFPGAGRNGGHWQIQYIKDTGDCLPV